MIERSISLKIFDNFFELRKKNHSDFTKLVISGVFLIVSPHFMGLFGLLFWPVFIYYFRVEEKSNRKAMRASRHYADQRILEAQQGWYL